MDRGLKNLFGLFCFVVALVLPVMGRPRTAAMCCVGLLLCRVENGNSPYPLRKLRPRFYVLWDKTNCNLWGIIFCGIMARRLWHDSDGDVWYVGYRRKCCRSCFVSCFGAWVRCILDLSSQVVVKKALYVETPAPIGPIGGPRHAALSWNVETVCILLF